MRMQNVMPTDTVFSLPQDYDYCAKADGSHFGVFTAETKYTFAVEFYNEAVLDIRERKWAADQKIKDIKDGISITFTSTQFEKVLEWVLSRGGNARPLIPQLLVQRWEKSIDKMIENKGKL
jgi:hypothetical protein